MNRFLYGTLLAAGGLYFAVGCTSTVTGNEGNLDFTYTADDQVTNFNKPVAVGAKLELRVVETGTREEVEVEAASTDNPDVLTVDTFSANRVILVGTGEGSTLVEVTATGPDGQSVSDSVNMLAAVPDTLSLSHTCSPSITAKYLAGTKDVRVVYEMAEDNGQPVIGYGYFPIEIEPAAAVTLDESSTSQSIFSFDLGTQTGPVNIASTLDNTSLELDITTEGAIDGIEPTIDAPVEVRVDATSFANFVPLVGDVPVCESGATLEAETSTPEICTVSAVAPIEAEGIAGRTGAVSIVGKSFGICEYTVTYPNAAGGEGVSASFEAEVGEFPDANLPD